MLLLSGIGLGAAAVFLLDPASGKRRRQRTLEFAVRVRTRAGHAAGALQRDFRNRLRGALSDRREHVGIATLDDAVLRERVHAAIGRIASHPHEIEVRVCDGCVTLNGPHLRADDRRRIVNAIGRVDGVEAVDLIHDLHTLPANTPLRDSQALRARTSGRSMVRRALAGTVGLLASALAGVFRQSGGRAEAGYAVRS
jgi:hypothetical protein